MPRHAKLSPRKLPSGMWRVDVAPSLSVSGKRTKKDFQSESRAITYINGIKRLRAQPICDTDEQRREAAILRERLPRDRTLTNAVDLALSIWERERTGRTFSAVSAQLIEAKRSSGASELYLRDITQKAGRFARDYGERLIFGIERGEIREWLANLRILLKDSEGDKAERDGGPLASESRNCYRRALSLVFNFATREGYIPSNPIAAVDTVKTTSAPIEIFTVDEARRLLAAAREHRYDETGRPSGLSHILPVIAIGLFSGLRPEETYLLLWSEIDFTRREIDITKGKTAARPRYVPMSDTLIAWLEPYRRREGRISPVSLWRTLGKVRRKAGLTHWPPDGLRHSFASYMLPLHPDVHALAAVMGNSVAVIHSHYRRPVRVETAREYWNILP